MNGKHHTHAESWVTVFKFIDVLIKAAGLQERENRRSDVPIRYSVSGRYCAKFQDWISDNKTFFFLILFSGLNSHVTGLWMSLSFGSYSVPAVLNPGNLSLKRSKNNS